MWDFDRFGESTAVADDSGTTLTYRELADEGKRLYQAMGRRTFVFCLCRNTAGAVMGYTSFINHRVVPLMLGADIDRDLLRSLLDIYQPEYIWLPCEMCGEFHPMERVYGSFGYALLKTGYGAGYRLNDDLCLLIPTSGSTGSPKLVRMSYENIRSNAESCLPLEKASKLVTVLNLPMQYAYIIAVLNCHLMRGLKVLPVTKSILQKGFWDFYRENGANEIHGVPNTYEALLRLFSGKTELPELELMTQSGGKMPLELSEKLAEFALAHGVRLFVMYGQSEATAILGYLSEDMILEKCGSIGKPLPGSAFYLVDENGNRISQSGVSGEMVFTGPGVTLGYAERREDLAKGDDFGGVLHTGDIATFDDDGYYYIVGRKKRFLKLYGKRVSLDETEALIKGKFPELDCAAAGSDDEMHIYMTDTSRAEEVIRFIAGKMGIFHGAFRAIGISEIPKNEAGKTLYAKLPE